MIFSPSALREGVFCVYICRNTQEGDRLDKDEFTQRVSQSRRKLFAIARTMLPERDCEDAVQSAMLSAWEHLSELRNDDAFDAWLISILKNRCRQIQRNYKKEKDSVLALAAQSTPFVDDVALEEALAQMKDEERALLLQHHEQGYSLREMSEQAGQTEDVLKMRLYRARRKLRILLISLLLLVLLAAAAVGVGPIDVSWFMQKRRAEPIVEHISSSAFQQIRYDGKLLSAEVSDAAWNLDELSVSFVYFLTAAQDDAFIVYSGNIGVDGIRFDHIWTQGEILPIADRAQGRKVITFTPDDWTLDGRSYPSSEDALPDGKGETFFVKLRLDRLKPDDYAKLLGEDGLLTLSCLIRLQNHASQEILEQGTLTLRISAPTAEEWRNAYEAYAL